jgi:hypothetical protein
VCGCVPPRERSALRWVRLARTPEVLAFGWAGSLSIQARCCLANPAGSSSWWIRVGVIAWLLTDIGQRPSGRMRHGHASNRKMIGNWRLMGIAS